MCRQRSLLAILICFLFTAIAVLPAHAAQTPDGCTLTMGWEPWHPYQYVDAQGALTGFDIELVEAVASSIDCVVDHREVNWARGLVDLQNGDLDLIASANFTEERSVWAHYSIPYRDSSIVIFMREGESKQYPLESLQDLVDTDLKLGVGRGVAYSEEFTKLTENPDFRKNLVYIPTSELQQYEMLQASRIDGFLRSITALQSLRELAGDKLNLEVHPFSVGGAKQHMILSKISVSDPLYKRFNKGLRNMIDSGVLDSLYAKYF